MLCFVAVLLWSCSFSAGVYGIWSCFDWSCSMLKMALKNLETSTVFMWYFIIRGRGSTSGFGCMFFDNADRSLPAQVGDVIRDGLLEARWSSKDKSVQMEVRPFLRNMYRIRCISVNRLSCTQL